MVTLDVLQCIINVGFIATDTQNSYHWRKMTSRENPSSLRPSSLTSDVVTSSSATNKLRHMRILSVRYDEDDISHFPYIEVHSE